MIVLNKMSNNLSMAFLGNPMNQNSICFTNNTISDLKFSKIQHWVGGKKKKLSVN